MAEYENVIKELDVLSCCLIGEYNEKGEYSINPDIVKELVNCTKLVTSYTVEGMDCQAQIGDYTAIFRVKFAVDHEQSVKFAGIYLIENYKFLGKAYSVETFLARYSDFDDQFFFDKFREIFNIVTKDESEGKDLKNHIPNYEEIKKQKKDTYKQMIEGLSDFNKRYVMEVLGMLKTSGGLGAEIRAQLKAKISKIKTERNTPKYWAEVKSELDILIEANREKYQEETKKLLEEINNRYLLNYKKIAKQLEKKKAKAAAKKKKKAKAKEADDYKPYYPKISLSKNTTTLRTDRFKFEYSKQAVPQAQKTQTKVHTRTHLNVHPVNPRVQSSGKTPLEELASSVSRDAEYEFAGLGSEIPTSEFEYTPPPITPIAPTDDLIDELTR